MDSKHDANDLNLEEKAGEALEAASGEFTTRRRKRRPLNPDGTPARRPRPERAAEDVAAEAERLFSENSPAADSGEERPRKKRRPRNPDGTPVRRPRPARPAEDGESLTPADWERELEALQRPRKKRRPRPDEEPVSGTERLLTDGGEERDFEEVQRQRRKRRMRPDRAAAAAALAAEDTAEDAVQESADEIEELIRPRKKHRPQSEEFEEPEQEAPEETPAEEEAPEHSEELFDDEEEAEPELDLDWRNEYEEEKPKKKSLFARLFGSKEEPEFDEDEVLEAEEPLDGDDAENLDDMIGSLTDEEAAEDDFSDLRMNSEDQDDAFSDDDFSDEAPEDGDYAEDREDDEDDYYYDDEPKKGRGLIIGIVAVCAAAVCVTAGCIFYVKSQPKKMLDLIKQGSYSDAADYYKDHSYAESEDIDRTIDAEADSILQKYLNEEMDYDTALAQMKQLEDIQKMRARTDFTRSDAVELIHGSRVHYEAGKTALDNKDYDTAIEEFGKTCEADTKYYEDAQNLIKEAEDGREKVRNDAIQQIVSDANALANAEVPDYLGAYKKLTEAAPLYDNDARITSAADSMKTSYINEKLTSADGLAAEHLYDDALGLLDIANGEMPGTAEIPAKIAEINKASTEYAYNEHKQQVIAEAAEAFDLYGAENAIFILQSAADLANDQEIRDKIKEYEAYKSSPVSVLKIADQHVAVKDVPSTKTPKETALTNVLQFQLVTTYQPFGITYSAGEGGYTKLAFTVAPDVMFSALEQCSAVVKVYADGALVYTSNTITAATEPFKAQASFPATTKVIKIVAEDTSTLDKAAGPARLYFDIYNITVGK